MTTTTASPTPDPEHSDGAETPSAATTATTTLSAPPTRSHREVLLPMSGLLLAMFVAILSGTVVSTSLPKIISDLGGDQAAFTWVVTATLLATAVSTPIWGKLADLLNRKLLVQLAISIFVLGTTLAGFSPDAGTLIAFRGVQGLGAGGLAALVQIVLADIVSPRERGKYMGLFGAVMAVGTVGGPLLGGTITDLIHWRGNFFVPLPFAIAALIVLQRTLHLPPLPARAVRIDYLGATCLAGSVSLLLIWVSLAGAHFDWISPTSAWMVGGSLVLLIALIITERHAAEPVIPLRLFSGRTFTLAVLASISVGVAMFGTTVYLSQYMQLARGASPTESGLMTLPMVLALMLSSTLAGALISRYGHWKPFMVTGSIMLTAGLALMGTIHYDTPFVLVALYMLIQGSGVGMVMQNLVLVVQNDVDPADIGAASSGVSFFRTLGGTIGVSALGAVLASRVTTEMTDRADQLATAVAQSGAAGAKAAKSLASGTLPAVNELPRPIAEIVEAVYGDGVAHLFLVASPLALITVVAVLLLPRRELGTQTTGERLSSGRASSGERASAPHGDAESSTGAAETAVEVAEAMVAATPDPDAEPDDRPVQLGKNVTERSGAEAP